MKSLAVGGALVSIAIALAYVTESEKKNANQIKLVKQESQKNFMESQNLSSVSQMKSLLNETKLQTAYGATFYPKNYFAQNWVLGVDPRRPQVKAVLKGDAEVDFKNFKQEPRIDTIEEIMKGKLQTKYFNNLSTVEIMKLNHDPIFTQWVRSVDVKASFSGSKEASRSQLMARIALDAPKPQSLAIQIKGPKDSDFGNNWGTESVPVEGGLFHFRMIGSGVIHYGQILVNHAPHSVGLDRSTGKISHSANNQLAKNEVIGEIPILIRARTEEDRNVDLSSCELESHTRTSSNSTFQTFSITAKVLGVDGTEADNISISKTLYIRSKAEADSDDALANDECRQFCPNDVKTVYDGASAADRAAFLDDYFNGITDPKRRDLYHKNLSDESHGAGFKGSVCVNLDDTAVEMFRVAGMRPSAFLAKDPAAFDKAEYESRRHARWYSYSAPSCERKFVALRNACGCFSEDTLITMADSSKMPISQLKRGDLVWNPKSLRAQAIARITAGPEKQDLLEITTNYGQVKVTEMHPFLTKRGLLAAKDLVLDDRIVNAGRSWKIDAIKKLKTDPSKYPIVWNIALEGDDANIDDHFILADDVMAGDLHIQESLQSGILKPAY